MAWLDGLKDKLAEDGFITSEVNIKNCPVFIDYFGTRK